MKIPLMKSTFLHEDEVKRKLCNFIMNTPKLSMGDQVAAFETEFSKWQQRAHSVMVNSGSSANLILIQSLLNLKRISKGDRVGISGLTWATNVMPVIQLGLIPVFIDVNVQTLNIHLDEVKKHKLDVLFITHLLGLHGDIVNIKEYCDSNSIILIEDTCESLGVQVNNRKLGNFGLASTFSTFVGHHMSTIEGGIVCTDDAELDMMLRMVRSHGWDRHVTEMQRNELRIKWGVDSFYGPYTFYVPGYNVRPCEINGFIGCEQLKHLNESNAIRRANYKLIREFSSSNNEIYIPDFDTNAFAIPIICKNSQVRLKYIDKCKVLGIECRPIVAGDITKQPFLEFNTFEELPNTTIIHETGLYIANHSEFTDSELDIIKQLVR
jgi:CDP-6-deoxy-D-xylo-4-hexulose-3-dehydrase